MDAERELRKVLESVSTFAALGARCPGHAPELRRSLLFRAAAPRWWLPLCHQHRSAHVRGLHGGADPPRLEHTFRGHGLLVLACPPCQPCWRPRRCGRVEWWGSAPHAWVSGALRPPRLSLHPPRPSTCAAPRGVPGPAADAKPRRCSASSCLPRPPPGLLVLPKGGHDHGPNGRIRQLLQLDWQKRGQRLPCSDPGGLGGPAPGPGPG
mmetsp:Transcript_10582/g.30319  ORF Transcript_10582/g.30319 Transcript_10582/m.30319 type:complete len:209 (+) Transcript_10582:741-1367(+)